MRQSVIWCSRCCVPRNFRCQYCSSQKVLLQVLQRYWTASTQVTAWRDTLVDEISSRYEKELFPVSFDSFITPVGVLLHRKTQVSLFARV